MAGILDYFRYIWKKKTTMTQEINILSLFDGMSCGQIALNRMGFNYNNYFASEIEKLSMAVTMHNFPDTKQIGSVLDIDAKTLPKIFLLMGGSPCQSFSMAGKKKGMSTKDDVEVLTLEQYLELKEQGFEFEGQSYLFWEYVRLLKETNPTFFLLENVEMDKKWEKIITDTLGVKPILINSNLVSAQNRKRLYWTNIPVDGLPEDKGLTIKDVIFDNTYKVFTDERITKTKKRTKNYIKFDLSGKGYWSQQDRAYYMDGKMCTMPKANPNNKLNIVLDEANDIYRRIHPVEAERLQTVGDGYCTNVPNIKETKILEMLGNGWTVDIIVFIFSFMKK